MGVLVYGLVALVALYLWSRSRKANANRLPVPPGPKPLPVIGNIFNLTPKELWLRMTEWVRPYGNVVYVHVFGQGLVFLNTFEAASDLLEKQGAIYSDKPPLVMAGELCGCENMVAFTRYGDMARRQRRLLTSALGASAVKTFRPLLQIESLSLVKHLLADPQDFAGYIRRYAGQLTLQSIYGHHVTSNDDEFVKLAEESVDILANRIASGGGIWLVDIFPFLKHLPLWFPGAGFKRKAIEWRKKMEEFVDRPYDHVRQRMRNGTAVPCFVTTVLENSSDAKESKTIDPQLDFDLRWTANSMYGASIDTTVTVVLHFMHQMMEHPEVLKEAQAEVDRVVGTSRLPDFEDRPSLPYLEALMNEVLRVSVPVPMGLPHRLMEDDVYNGMFIPKGSLVFANIWNMLRDESVYPDPHAFNPARFLAPADEATVKRRDPRHYVFGFGRRRCPGAHLIEQSLWTVIATAVATLDIHKPIGPDGKTLEQKVVFENSVFRLPSSFQCDIRPRSSQALRVVREATDALGI